MLLQVMLFLLIYAAKVRRLYDIANVLSSMRYIEKVIIIRKTISGNSTLI